MTIARNVYKIAAKLTWVGITVAPDEQSAIEAAAKEFGQPADRLIVDGAVKKSAGCSPLIFFSHRKIKARDLR